MFQDVAQNPAKDGSGQIDVEIGECDVTHSEDNDSLSAKVKSFQSPQHLYFLGVGHNPPLRDFSHSSATPRADLT